MSRRVSIVLLAVIACVMVVPPAIAMPKSHAGDAPGGNQLVVRISKGHVELGADGTVLVSLRTRCQPPLFSFELDVSVRQEAAVGSVVMLGTGVPPCDGRWHRISVLVSADDGSFTSGVTTADAFLGVFDPMEGDLEAVDTVTVKL